jgi:hypothetical protein
MDQDKHVQQCLFIGERAINCFDRLLRIEEGFPRFFRPALFRAQSFSEAATLGNCGLSEGVQMASKSKPPVMVGPVIETAPRKPGYES